MLSIEQLKRIEPELTKLSEEELSELRETLYRMAQFAFDVWWHRKSGSKNPVGLFPSQQDEAKIQP